MFVKVIKDGRILKESANVSDFIVPKKGDKVIIDYSNVYKVLEIIHDYSTSLSEATIIVIVEDR